MNPTNSSISICGGNVGKNAAASGAQTSYALQRNYTLPSTGSSSAGSNSSNSSSKAMSKMRNCCIPSNGDSDVAAQSEQTKCATIRPRGGSFSHHPPASYAHHQQQQHHHQLMYNTLSTSTPSAYGGGGSGGHTCPNYRGHHLHQQMVPISAFSNHDDPRLWQQKYRTDHHHIQHVSGALVSDNDPHTKSASNNENPDVIMLNKCHTIDGAQQQQQQQPLTPHHQHHHLQPLENQNIHQHHQHHVVHQCGHQKSNQKDRDDCQLMAAPSQTTTATTTTTSM